MNNFQKVIIIATLAAIVSAICIYGLLTPTEVVELQKTSISKISDVHYVQEGPYDLLFSLEGKGRTIYQVTYWYGATEYISVPAGSYINLLTLNFSLESGEVYEVDMVDYYELYSTKYNNKTKKRLLEMFTPMISE